MNPTPYQKAEMRLRGRIYRTSGFLIVAIGSGKTLRMEVTDAIKTPCPQTAKDLPREVARWARGVAMELLLAADRIETLKDDRPQTGGAA